MCEFSQLTQGCIRYLQISSIAHGGYPLPVGKYNCAINFVSLQNDGVCNFDAQVVMNFGVVPCTCPNGLEGDFCEAGSDQCSIVQN